MDYSCILLKAFAEFIGGGLLEMEFMEIHCVGFRA